VNSLESFWNAVQAFVDALGSVAFGPLLLAIACLLLNLVLRSRAWRNILAAAYPAEHVAIKPIFGAYCAGVGVNAVVPARGGDVVKLLLAHRSIPNSSYPALTSSLLAETVFDFVMGSLVLLWAIGFGIAPFPDLPSLPLFEFSWMARHPMATGIGVILLVGGILAAVILAQHRIRAFWARVEQGLTILRTPRRYLREVAAYQFAGWVTRVFTAFFFLQAFHVPATLRNALLIMVVGAVATIMPFTPGGAGPKQALLVVLLAGEAARSDVLALSVGMEIATAATNVALGALCMTFIFRGLGLRGAIAHARESTRRPKKRGPRPPSEQSRAK
jgi:uncharacterized membrane protein YbhN (UPF0104 family)